MDLWVAGPSVGTVADCTVAADGTLGVKTTGVSNDTRVLAALVDTSQVTGTFRVCSTLRRCHRLCTSQLTSYNYSQNLILGANAYK